MCFVDLGYTADDVVQYATECMVFILPQNLDSHPQFRMIIIPQGDRELVIAVMSHVLADGAGFLQYLYLLAAFYNGNQPERKIQNQRDVSFLLKGIRVLTPTEQTRHYKQLSACTLRQQEKAISFCVLPKGKKTRCNLE